MANQEHLEILKQGVDVWNKWREENPDLPIDLREANLVGADLRRAKLNRVNLHRADLSKADLTLAMLYGAELMEAIFTNAILYNAKLTIANLKGAKLNRADLSTTHLSRAVLTATDLTEANLTEADLSGANLNTAHLMEAKLRKTDLSGAHLSKADLTSADLKEAKFDRSQIGETIFGNVDLSEAIGLEKIHHFGPSTIGTDTLAASKGNIPEVFLRGCGLSDWEIESTKLFNPELTNEAVNRTLYKMYDLRASQALQISPLFISYSHADNSFVEKIERKLNNKGVRFWRDVHDATAGRLEKQISRAIRLNPTVLLILSDHSIESDWVEHEVHTARELEKEMKRDVLCPIALDDSWKKSSWEKRIMEQVMKYNILDFSEWEDDESFGNTFNKLIDGLELFYK